MRFPRILNSTQHLVIDNANQIQHAEVHLLASYARVLASHSAIVAFGSNQLLQPHRSPDQTCFPQNNLRLIFSHLRYHAPYGNVDFRRIYSAEPNLMKSWTPSIKPRTPSFIKNRPYIDTYHSLDKDSQSYCYSAPEHKINHSLKQDAIAFNANSLLIYYENFVEFDLLEFDLLVEFDLLEFDYFVEFDLFDVFATPPTTWETVDASQPSFD